MAYQVQLFLNRPVLSTQNAQQTQQTRNGRTRVAQSIGSQDWLQRVQIEHATTPFPEPSPHFGYLV